MKWYKRYPEKLIKSEVWKDRDLRHVWSDLMDLAGCGEGDGKIRDLYTHDPMSIGEVSRVTGWPLEELNAHLKTLQKTKNDDDKPMLHVDTKGYITLTKWGTYNSEYLRQKDYRSSYKSGYKPSYSLGAGLDDAEYALYLISLYKITEEQYNKEKIKMEAWLSTPKGRGRKMTRQFIVGWLNKCDFALAPPKPSPFDFYAVFNQYPELKRIEETECRTIFNATVKTEKDFKDIQAALRQYLASEREQKTKPEFIKRAPKWFAVWRDYIPEEEWRTK